MDPPTLYIKRTAPLKPGRGTITLTPGNWTSSGTWTATEDQHEDEPIFSSRSGAYAIRDRVVTLLGADSKTAVRIIDWGTGPGGAGSGVSFDPAGNSSMKIAWKLSPWLPD